jgi:ABC-2 type transport system ATP-binding protein
VDVVSSAIELEHLTKRYGSRRGIDDVTLTVPAGTIFGFVGPNGAGKSTTIRTLLGLMRPTSGRARLLGRDPHQDGAAARLGVGYVPGEVALYDDLAVGDLLAYLGRFHPGDHRARRADLIARLEVDVRARAPQLSLGNRKKVAIVAALQHRPRLVILDEPTSGLDPLVQRTLFELLGEEAARGATVFFSSHVLTEVQRTCRTVAVIAEGRLVAVEDVAELRRRQLRRVRATFAGEPPAAPLAALAGVGELVRDGDSLGFLYGGDTPALLRALADAQPIDARIEEPTLEEIVLQHYLRGAA